MRRALSAAVRHHRYHNHHLLQQESQVSLQPQPSPWSARSPRLCRTKPPCLVHKQATRCLSQLAAKLRNTDASHYFDPPFWDSTYATDPLPLEWYQSYSELSPLLKKYIPTHSRVLVSGCGNSGSQIFCACLERNGFSHLGSKEDMHTGGKKKKKKHVQGYELSEDMVKDGYNEIVNIDISPVVIEAMKKKYQDVPQLKYMTMDVLDLSYFDNCSFDSVIDKGTLDAIMCVAGGPYNIAMMLAEITRIMKPGGIYMLVSFASPCLSLPLLNRDAFGWSIDPYIITKQGSSAGGQNPYSEPVLLDSDGAHANNLTLEGSDSLYIYMCTKLP